MKNRSLWILALAAVMLFSTLSGALAADPFGKYDPPVDVTFVRSIDNDLATNILPRTPDETIEKNRWLDLYKEELGINISYDWTVMGGYNDDQYRQKINVTLAGGDLPDIITVHAAQLKQLADAGQIEDMTQYWEDYAADLTKAIYSEEGPGVLDSARFDGKLMAIPNAEASIESAHFLWIRKDWLDKLGLEPPTNMEELLAISEAFTKQDPDGNGVDDTFGIAVQKNLYGGVMALDGFFAGFHAYPNFWLEKDGELVYGSILPEMKDALAQLAKMYANGELDQEFGVKDGGKVAETIAAGKVGIDFGEQWNPMYPMISNFYNDPEADWTGYPLVSVDENLVKVPLNFRTYLYFAVRKGFAHPELVVKMVNMHLEKNWGETNDFGYYYMPQENGNVGVWKFSPVTPFPPYKNYNAFQAIQAARAAGDLSTLVGEPKVISENVTAYNAGDHTQWGWEKIYGVGGVYNVMEGYIANDQLMVEAFVGAPTPTMVERRSTLEKLENEVFVRIIMGASPVDDFDKFVEDWLKLGGEAMTNEVNDWYEGVK